MLWVKILLGYCLFVVVFCWLMQRAGRYFRSGGTGGGPADRQIIEVRNPTSRL